MSDTKETLEMAKVSKEIDTIEKNREPKKIGDSRRDKLGRFGKGNNANIGLIARKAEYLQKATELAGDRLAWLAISDE